MLEKPIARHPYAHPTITHMVPLSQNNSHCRHVHYCLTLKLPPWLSTTSVWLLLLPQRMQAAPHCVSHTTRWAGCGQHSQCDAAAAAAAAAHSSRASMRQNGHSQLLLVRCIFAAVGIIGTCCCCWLLQLPPPLSVQELTALTCQMHLRCCRPHHHLLLLLAAAWVLLAARQSPRVLPSSCRTAHA